MEDRYTPTKLEWLVISIQSRAPMLLSQVRMLLNQKAVDDIRVFFRAQEPDTAVVVIRHLKDVPQEVVKILTDEIVREIKDIAKAYGWDGWLKIEWDVP
jgi:hypothetical protein